MANKPLDTTTATRLILVRAAQTEWQAQDRLTGDTDLQLNELGHRQAAAYAKDIAGLTPQAIYCGSDQATRQTASIIADELQLKSKVSDNLCEMDLGHWEGLTNADFRDRFAKVHRQWRDDPLAVEPPDGESVTDLALRLVKGLEKILKRGSGQTIILVLGHFAYATARCKFEDGDFLRFWEYIDGEEQWHMLSYVPSEKEEAKMTKASKVE